MQGDSIREFGLRSGLQKFRLGMKEFLFLSSLMDLSVAFRFSMKHGIKLVLRNNGVLRWFNNEMRIIIFRLETSWLVEVI